MSEDRRRSSSAEKAAVSISFVIPVYNAEAYLPECLQSVMQSTYRSFEVILVDDGSSDGSPRLIESFRQEAAASGIRVRTIRQNNAGPSAARNRGIREAVGEWICFLDADDYLEPGFLERMITAIQGADACLSGRKRLDERTGRAEIEPCPVFTGDKEEVRKRLRHMMKLMRGATGRLYRREIIERHALCFREDLRYGEDMCFNFLYFRHIRTASFAGYTGYVYRKRRRNSLTAMDRTFFLKRWKLQRQCIRDTFYGQ